MLVTVGELDPAMVEIGKGIELSQAGERAAARQVFADLWRRPVLTGTRSIAAPWPTRWPMSRRPGRRAGLGTREPSSGRPGDRRARTPRREGVLPVAAPQPWRRVLGDLELARAHLQLGQAALGALGEDSYAQMVKGGLDRLADRFSAI